jgi:hypothetical protein
MHVNSSVGYQSICRQYYAIYRGWAAGARPDRIWAVLAYSGRGGLRRGAVEARRRRLVEARAGAGSPLKEKQGEGRTGAAAPVSSGVRLPRWWPRGRRGGWSWVLKSAGVGVRLRVSASVLFGAPSFVAFRRRPRCSLAVLCRPLDALPGLSSPRGAVDVGRARGALWIGEGGGCGAESARRVVLVVWPALCGGCEVATLCRAKVLFLAAAGTDGGGAFFWRRDLLGGVVVVVFLRLRPGAPGETLIPRGIGRGRHFPVSFCLLGSSPWLLRRPEGAVERVGCRRRRAVWLPRLGGQANASSVSVCSG